MGGWVGADPAPPDFLFFFYSSPIPTPAHCEPVDALLCCLILKLSSEICTHSSVQQWSSNLNDSSIPFSSFVISVFLFSEKEPADLGQPQSVSMTTGIGGEGMGRTLQSSRFEQKHEVSVWDWSHHVLRF